MLSAMAHDTVRLARGVERFISSSPEAAAIVSGLIGGFVSGGLGAFATLWAYGHGYLKISRSNGANKKLR